MLATYGRKTMMQIGMLKLSNASNINKRIIFILLAAFEVYFILLRPLATIKSLHQKWPVADAIKEFSMRL
jgi:hypothetical protein